MKIVHTPIRFFPFMGGIEHSTYHLCRALVAQGCDIKVICADEGADKGNDIIDGMEVERLSYITKVTNTNIALGLPWKLWREPCDIIHTYMPTPWSADWSILIGKLRKKKTVISIKNDMHHDAFLANIIDKIYVNTVMRFSIRLVDRIFMVNPEWQSTFVNTRKVFIKHKAKITIVPNGIDLELFGTMNIKRDKNEILFVSVLSSFHKYKGLDDLLVAVQQVASKLPKLHLTVVGEGELRSSYEELANTLGISKHVTFAGQSNQKTLSRYYSRAQAFVLPSKGVEGFGNVVLESLACQTPVIVSNVVGMAEDIEASKSGIVVEPNQPTQLAEALMKVMTDAKAWNSMSINGVRLVRDKYTWQTVAAQVKHEYEALLT